MQGMEDNCHYWEQAGGRAPRFPLDHQVESGIICGAYRQDWAMSKYKKSLETLQGNGPVRFSDIERVADQTGFSKPKFNGADAVFTHPNLPYPLTIACPHAGNDRVKRPYVEIFVEALENLGVIPVADDEEDEETDEEESK